MIMKAQEVLGFPWNTWTPFEVDRWNRKEPLFNLQLFKLLSPLLYLTLIAFISFIKSKKPEKIFLLVWALIPFMLLPFADSFQIPKIRMVQMLPFIPYGLLLTSVIFELLPKIKLKKIIYPLIIVIIAVNLYFSVSQYLIKINYYKSVSGGYFSDNVLEAFSRMDKLIPRNTVVLSWEYEGIAIPSFTGAKVYFGQLSHTKDFFAKKEKVSAFLKKQWDDKIALDFLRINDIKYVYFGRYEKEISGTDLTYPFLKEVYKNNEVTLYRVI
jgi:hypothetical protein